MSQNTSQKNNASSKKKFKIQKFKNIFLGHDLETGFVKSDQNIPTDNLNSSKSLL